MQGAAGSDEDTAASAEAMAARAEIADDPHAPKLAPEGYDVTIISYSDYQCPFCRKIHPALERLAQEDGRVRIVYRSEEHTSELQSLMRISYAVFCLKKKKI